MIKIETVGIIDAQKQIAALTPEFHKKARKAIRATMKDAKSKAVEAVLERFTIKKFAVKNSLRTEISPLRGELLVMRELILLNYFKTSPKKRINRRGKYVKVETRKGHSYIDKMLWRIPGDQRLWKRKGRKRLPIEKKYGPDTTDMFGDSVVSKKILKFMENKFVENFV